MANRTELVIPDEKLSDNGAAEQAKGTTNGQTTGAPETAPPIETDSEEDPTEADLKEASALPPLEPEVPTQQTSAQPPGGETQREDETTPVSAPPQPPEQQTQLPPQPPTQPTPREPEPGQRRILAVGRVDTMLEQRAAEQAEEQLNQEMRRGNRFNPLNIFRKFRLTVLKNRYKQQYYNQALRTMQGNTPDEDNAFALADLVRNAPLDRTYKRAEYQEEVRTGLEHIKHGEAANGEHILSLTQTENSQLRERMIREVIRPLVQVATPPSENEVQDKLRIFIRSTLADNSIPEDMRKQLREVFGNAADNSRVSRPFCNEILALRNDIHAHQEALANIDQHLENVDIRLGNIRWAAASRPHNTRVDQAIQAAERSRTTMAVNATTITVAASSAGYALKQGLRTGATAVSQPLATLTPVPVAGGIAAGVIAAATTNEQAKIDRSLYQVHRAYNEADGKHEYQRFQPEQVKSSDTILEELAAAQHALSTAPETERDARLQELIKLIGEVNGRLNFYQDGVDYIRFTDRYSPRQNLTRIDQAKIRARRVLEETGLSRDVITQRVAEAEGQWRQARLADLRSKEQKFHADRWGISVRLWGKKEGEKLIVIGRGKALSAGIVSAAAGIAVGGTGSLLAGYSAPLVGNIAGAAGRAVGGAAGEVGKYVPVRFAGSTRVLTELTKAAQPIAQLADNAPEPVKSAYRSASEALTRVKAQTAPGEPSQSHTETLSAAASGSLETLLAEVNKTSLQHLYEQGGEIHLPNGMTLFSDHTDHSLAFVNAEGNRLNRFPVFVGPQGELYACGDLNSLPESARSLFTEWQTQAEPHEHNYRDLFQKEITSYTYAEGGANLQYPHHFTRGIGEFTVDLDAEHDTWINDPTTTDYPELEGSKKMSLRHEPTGVQLHGFAQENGTFKIGMYGNRDVTLGQLETITADLRANGFTVTPLGGSSYEVIPPEATKFIPPPLEGINPPPVKQISDFEFPWIAVSPPLRRPAPLEGRSTGEQRGRNNDQNGQNGPQQPRRRFPPFPFFGRREHTSPGGPPPTPTDQQNGQQPETQQEIPLRLVTAHPPDFQNLTPQQQERLARIRDQIRRDNPGLSDDEVQTRAEERLTQEVSGDYLGDDLRSLHQLFEQLGTRGRIDAVSELFGTGNRKFVWQEVRLGPELQRQSDNLYRGYLMVEPDDLPTALYILLQLATERKREGKTTDFKWLTMTAPQFATTQEFDHYINNRNNIGKYDRLEPADPRIAIYADSVDEVKDILSRLCRHPAWRDIEQRRIGNMGGRPENAPRRPGTSAYTDASGQEWRTLNFNDQPGYSEDVARSPGWRNRVQGTPTTPTQPRTP